MQQSILDGTEALRHDGFTYLPKFVTTSESDALLQLCGALHPLWEERHLGETAGRQGQRSRGLTRPVYWLGAWQFAALGYYAEPHHREDRCLRAEPLHEAMVSFLERLRDELARHQTEAERGLLPNTCLINFYGSELLIGRNGLKQPVDRARLKMHRDGEPGPVVMLSLGQPAQFEFIDPQKPKEPVLSMWLRHRSAVILSGSHYKDFLYHQVTHVRHGLEPVMPQPVPDFSLRRVSVSFRYVPEALIKNLNEFGPEAQLKISGYVRQLAAHSSHFAQQHQRLPGGE